MENLSGRTYSLPEDGEYYPYIAEQVDKLSAIMGGIEALDKTLSCLVARGRRYKRKYAEFEAAFGQISARMLELYTPDLPAFLETHFSKAADDEIFRIPVRGYQLRMLHIEVLNRSMQGAFLRAGQKVIILPHCLRDFRADTCCFQPGDVDYVCAGCNAECQINLTRILLKEYPEYHLYISQNQDLEKVFRLAQQIYGDIGLIGVACVPELYAGMTLARRMGIPAQGVLLNYNRCRRWMRTALYTNFNLEELARLLHKSNRKGAKVAKNTQKTFGIGP